MKKIIYFIFILLQMNLFGQETLGRWKIGFNFSPEATHRYITQKNGKFSQWPSQGNSYHKPRLGYTAGLSTAFSLTRKIGLETGICYSYKGFGSEIIQGNTNNIKILHVANHNKEINFRYLEVPLKITYSTGVRPLHFIASFSITTGYLIEARNMVNVELNSGMKYSEGSVSTDEYNPFNLTLSVSAGLEYDFDWIQLRMESLFRFGTISVQDKSINGFSTYLWSTGINIGCYFRL